MYTCQEWQSIFINEFDEQFNKKLESLDIKTELYQRYADDVDLIVRSVGRKIKFNPESGELEEKTPRDVHDEKDEHEDELTMREMKRIADTIMVNIETEYDCPSRHPELGLKVPVLDLAVWVEEVEMAPPRLENLNIHSQCCSDEICLPVGEPRAADQPPHHQSYAPPAHRGLASGVPNHHNSPDTQLIATLGVEQVQVQSEQPPEPGPHLAPGCCNPGRSCPTMGSGRSTIGQSQPGHLATRTSETSSQDVGLHPPITDVGRSRGHPSNPYAPPAHRGGRPGASNFGHSSSQSTEIIQPTGSSADPRIVEQVRFEFFSKPMAPKKIMLASSAQPWNQKRTTLTQELIRRLLNCSKELPCRSKAKHLTDFMQLLKNSGYSEAFRAEILKSGLKGYNKILSAERDGVRPMYRPKGWKESARWLAKRRKKKEWLGTFWKACIFVPPTPGSQLKKLMQAKEEETRAGGRESIPIKIIETAGRTLEQTLVNNDPFNGNQCSDAKCEPRKNGRNKINCRRNGVCYRISCLLCLRAGRPGDVTRYLEGACYYGESAKNMHCRSKEHVSKFNSKSEKVRSESAFYKHLLNTHGGKADNKDFSDYFEVQILKSYKKPFTRLVEEGTFIANHNGELLNSKSEWHQAKVVRTTTQVVQGGAEVLQRQRGGGHEGQLGGGHGHEGVHVGELGRQQAGGDGGEVVGRAEVGAEQPLGRRARGRARGQ